MTAAGNKQGAIVCYCAIVWIKNKRKFCGPAAMWNISKSNTWSFVLRNKRPKCSGQEPQKLFCVGQVLLLFSLFFCFFWLKDTTSIIIQERSPVSCNSALRTCSSSLSPLIYYTHMINSLLSSSIYSHNLFSPVHLVHTGSCKWLHIWVWGWGPIPTDQSVYLPVNGRPTGVREDLLC